MNKIILTGTQIFRTVILLAILCTLVLLIIGLHMQLWKYKVLSSYLHHKLLKKAGILPQLRSGSIAPKFWTINE